MRNLFDGDGFKYPQEGRNMRFLPGCDSLFTNTVYKFIVWSFCGTEGAIHGGEVARVDSGFPVVVWDGAD